MGFDEPQLLIPRRRDFGEHVGCARIAPSGTLVYGAHRPTELGQRPPHSTKVAGWLGDMWNGPRPT